MPGDRTRLHDALLSNRSLMKPERGPSLWLMGAVSFISYIVVLGDMLRMTHRDSVAHSMSQRSPELHFTIAHRENSLFLHNYYITSIAFVCHSIFCESSRSRSFNVPPYPCRDCIICCISIREIYG